MNTCEQTKGQTILQHGQSVWEYYKDLIKSLKEPKFVSNKWNLPECLFKNNEEILSNLFDKEIIEAYALFHDCGKPFCKTIDEVGRTHFPNHAQVSYETWLSFSNNQIVANLILNDMKMHTMRSREEIESFCKTEDIKTICTLLLVSWAELHSNANVLFGGTDSVSFKIKRRALERTSKIVLSSLLLKKS